MKKTNFPHEAIAVIDDILQYGRSKHAEGSWRSESVRHHVEKAKGHIQDWLYEVERGEDHLACALTRMAMALAVRTSGEKTENKQDNISIVLQDRYGSSEILSAPRNSRSVIIEADTIETVHTCLVRDQYGTDTLLLREDYSK